MDKIQQNSHRNNAGNSSDYALAHSLLLENIEAMGAIIAYLLNFSQSELMAKNQDQAYAKLHNSLALLHHRGQLSEELYKQSKWASLARAEKHQKNLLKQIYSEMEQLYPIKGPGS